MPSYVFESITAAQALAFNGATDTLTFSAPSASASSLEVVYSVSANTITLTSVGRTVTFSPSVGGAFSVIFPDNSNARIGQLSFANRMTGSTRSDALFGGSLADTLDGADGADTLNGGPGPDVLSGGPGNDLFRIAPGESLPGPAVIDVITDWQTTDALSFSGPAGTSANYLEATALTLAAAQGLANAQIAGGTAAYVAVQVGSDVIVFADSRGDHGAADDAVVLQGRTLSDISAGNIVPRSGAPGVPPTPPPQPPPGTLPGVQGAIAGNLDAVQVSHLIGTEILTATSTSLVLRGLGGISLTLAGTGFTYDADFQVTGGTVNTIDFVDNNGGVRTLGHVEGLSVPVATLSALLFAGASAQMFATLFGGSDTIGGSSFADLLRGFDGSDLLYGFGGSDTMYGGAGDDTLTVGVPQGGDSPGPGPTYLRGDEGNDSISGGAAFDDINGNMGNDTADGGVGDDWVVGGKDNDLMFGGLGGDLVYGNIGADTCDGGDGNDIVRGGQDNDVVLGGGGDDFVSGDKGDDTMTGGTGADLFHTFGDAGIDRVTDFSLAQGDRVQLDPGTQFTVSQVGADTVINMTGGGQMILAGVSMATLTPGWIFGA